MCKCTTLFSALFAARVVGYWPAHEMQQSCGRGELCVCSKAHHSHTHTVKTRLRNHYHNQNRLLFASLLSFPVCCCLSALITVAHSAHCTVGNVRDSRHMMHKSVSHLLCLLFVYSSFFFWFIYYLLLFRLLFRFLLFFKLRFCVYFFCLKVWNVLAAVGAA